jgi:hypothetical protein
MNENILFDTSSIRGISYSNLQALNKKGYKLKAPSYCFWEMFSHIDEDEFEKCKSQLMKLEYVELIDDAYGQLKKRILTEDQKIQKQVSDKEIIMGLLHALKISSNIDDFYSRILIDSNEQGRLLKNAGENTRKTLNRLEEEHIEFLENIIDAIYDKSLKYNSVDDRHELVLSLIDGEALRLIDQGANEDGLQEILVNCTYIYYSCILHQDIENIEKGRKFRPNDYEDSKICLHINLDSNVVFITEDSKLKNLLRNTALLQKIG